MKSDQNSKVIKNLLVISIFFTLILSNISILNRNIVESNNFDNSVNNLEGKELRTSTASGGGYIMDPDASYNWFEISSTGTKLNGISESDNNYEIIPLPWNFTFYDQEFEQIYVSSNGWLSFSGNDVSDSYCSGIPELNDENEDMVALFYTDLNLDDTNQGGGDVYYQSFNSPNRLIIEYRDVYHDDTADKVGTFEVIFYESGTIKFQYYLEDLDFSYKIGLDHGDLTNYNYFDEWSSSDVPISSKAIEFTFDQMEPIDYSINAAIGNEYSWIVTDLDNEKMNMMFGTEWEGTLDLPNNPKLGEKMKIEISTITDNSTHWDIHYNTWDWTNRLENFSGMCDGNDHILFKQDPLTYNQKHNLTNIIPFIMPVPAILYLKYANLSDNYWNVHDGGDFISYQYTISKMINGSEIEFDIDTNYDKQEGYLESYKIEWENLTGSGYGRIFKLETVTTDHLTNFSLGIDVGDQNSWILTKLDQEKLNYSFGENWTEIFGLFSDPKRGEKIKMNINSITTNLTHWDMSYNLWNWTSRFEDFSVTPDGNDKLIYRLDPFNYSVKITDSDNLFPFIFPCPVKQYIDFSIYSEIYGSTYYSTYENTTKISFYDYIGGDVDIKGKAIYNSLGILEKYDFIWENGSSNEEKVILSLKSFTAQYGELSKTEIAPTEQYQWVTGEINNTIMETYFGNNWETDLGLPENPSEFNKIKAEITSISENTTDYDINYDLWNWAPLRDDYAATPITADTLTYKKDPFNYTISHDFKNTFPLFLLSPTDIFLECCLLNQTSYMGTADNPFYNISKITFYQDLYNGELEVTASYTSKGILKHLSIDLAIQKSDTTKVYTALELSHYYYGEKPAYVGINEEEEYIYDITVEDVKENLMFPPDYEGPEQVKLGIEFIGGNDPDYNDTLIMTTRTFKESGEWDKGTIGGLYICDESLSIAFDYMGMTSSIATFIISSNMNWEILAEYFESINDPSIKFSIINNGFNLTQIYGDSTISNYVRYNSDGLLDIMGYSVNGTIIYKVELIDNISETEEENDVSDNEKDSVDLEIPGYNLYFIMGSILIFSILYQRKRK